MICSVQGAMHRVVIAGDGCNDARRGFERDHCHAVLGAKLVDQGADLTLGLIDSRRLHILRLHRS